MVWKMTSLESGLINVFVEAELQELTKELRELTDELLHEQEVEEEEREDTELHCEMFISIQLSW